MWQRVCVCVCATLAPVCTDKEVLDIAMRPAGPFYLNQLERVQRLRGRRDVISEGGLVGWGSSWGDFEVKKRFWLKNFRKSKIEYKVKGRVQTTLTAINPNTPESLSGPDAKFCSMLKKIWKLSMLTFWRQVCSLRSQKDQDSLHPTTDI